MSDKSKKRIAVIYIGGGGFPKFFTAVAQKSYLIAKCFLTENIRVHILNRNVSHYKVGHYKKVTYANLPLKAKLINLILFWLHFIRVSQKFKNKKYKVVVFVTYSWLTDILFLRFLSKILNFTVIINIMEWHLASDNKSIKAILFDNIAVRFCDAFIPISDFIRDELKKRIPYKPFLKIPILVDYNAIESISCSSNKERNKYFLYCGTAGYYSVIKIIMDAYSRYAMDGGSVSLKLVISGKSKYIEAIENEIKNNKYEKKIQLLSKLPYEDLIYYYKNALAFLIPLRNNTQDKARFPHKIGEYLACKRPIITTNWGEVRRYFTNNINSFIAGGFNSQSLSEVMKKVANNESLCDIVGKNGYDLGKKMFHYERYSKELVSFIESV
jgi:glycosyltransferase involved in cell wall biosynthesis